MTGSRSERATIRMSRDASAIEFDGWADRPTRLRIGGGIRINGTLPEWTGSTMSVSSDVELDVTAASVHGVTLLMQVRGVGDSITVAVSVSNERASPVVLTSLQPLVLELPSMPTNVESYASRWGLEFEPLSLDPQQPQTIHVTAGRSAQGAGPLVRLIGETGNSLVVTPHISGNWQIESVPIGGRLLLTAGLPTAQSLLLAPGESRSTPAVTIGWGASTALAGRAVAYGALDRAPVGPPLLTEWNHWWPYEDQDIDEDVFLANAAIAARVGLEVAVLDAGWFGDAAADSDWVQQRGDWHKVNTARFPHGLPWLAEQTRRLGIEFGIWVEAEAVGGSAELQTLHPDFVATSSTDAGRSLGYVCLGSPAAREYIATTVQRLIRDTSARWIKWDFNLDPGAGCDRADHGHRADEGLVAHYDGLYRIFDELRSDFPDTVFEACSSGGLRIDPGLAQHVDCLFLSDPDWTEHHLTCLWGACQMLPPRQILHWMQSEWRTDHRFQKVDYSGTLITMPQFDIKVQAAMLHRFGVSVRLPEMRPDLLDRLAGHIAAYKECVRPLLERGVLMPLNDQPLREERGNRCPAFQLTAGDDHLVAAYRLPPLEPWGPVHPIDLDPTVQYQVRTLDLDGVLATIDGATLLAEGIPLPGPESMSTLVLLRRA